MKQPDEDEAEKWRVLLKTRSERLVKLLWLNAPKRAIANEVLLVFNAGVAHCGSSMAEAMLESARRSAGLCTECGKPSEDILCWECQPQKDEDHRN